MPTSRSLSLHHSSSSYVLSRAPTLDKPMGDFVYLIQYRNFALNSSNFVHRLQWKSMEVSLNSRLNCLIRHLILCLQSMAKIGLQSCKSFLLCLQSMAKIGLRSCKSCLLCLQSMANFGLRSCKNLANFVKPGNASDLLGKGL